MTGPLVQAVELVVGEQLASGVEEVGVVVVRVVVLYWALDHESLEEEGGCLEENQEDID